MSLFSKFFGSFSDKELKKIEPIAQKVMSLEEQFQKLSNDELKNKTNEFKQRLAKGETLNDLLPEAFATVRETAWRVLGMKPYYVQVVGGIVLHQGRIAEMKTGEGKTLVATMPAYLNALEGKGVYVVTVNSYLAKRDSEQMGKIYNFLGLSVGLIEHNMHPANRQVAYRADITYTTNNEVGFDYLKDNMVQNKAHKVQRPFNYAIIDEVDSVLIDEARTPLIISGQSDESTEGYFKANEFVKTLKFTYFNPEETTSRLEAILSKPDTKSKYDGFDYVIDEKNKSVSLTESGVEKAEKFYGVDNLANIENVTINHYITRALKAHALFKRDVDYVVNNNEIVIVDEHTGRLMDGRRYSEGIHQAIETKENVEVKNESKTLATISFQNLFRKFYKLGGMTGTALTEEDEFRQIYGLDVIVIPTNKPILRMDLSDKVYLNKKAKLNAIVNRVKECNEKGQPVLVGTTSVEGSEELSRLFNEAKIKHTVLNAKNHEREAFIVANAGTLGAVTIATNMAGRGTDILLGGNAVFQTRQELANLGYTHEIIEMATMLTDTDDELVLEARSKYNEIYERISAKIKPMTQQVIELGGLYILGTERHSNRRIDNQLRGRAGRQGDPGVSEFMISLEDDLMRLFGSDKLPPMLLSTLSGSDDIPIEHKMISKSIESAQVRIEQQHFDVRKHLLDYDSVVNQHREIVYEQRDTFLEENDVKEYIFEMIKTFITENIEKVVDNPKKLTLVDQERINKVFVDIIGIESLPNYTEAQIGNYTAQDIIDVIYKEVETKYNFFIEHTDKRNTTMFEKRMVLFLIDNAWQEHIVVMDKLKEGIGLRALGQKDPLMEYKNEGYDLFEEMLNFVRKDVLRNIMANYANLINVIQAQIAMNKQEQSDDSNSSAE